MKNFDFLIHRQKMSEFPMKNIVCFKLREVKMKVFAYGL